MSLGAESHASIPLPLGYQLLLKGCSNVLWPLQHIPESEKKKKCICLLKILEHFEQIRGCGLDAVKTEEAEGF